MKNVCIGIPVKILGINRKVKTVNYELKSITTPLYKKARKKSKLQKY